MRKFIPVSEATHAKLTVQLGKEIVKNKGRRVTFDQLINSLMKKK
jgi:hypothetical protein